MLCVNVGSCGFFFFFQGKSHRARCEHEKAAGGGHEDKAEVLAGDGEKLQRAIGRAGKEGSHNTAYRS